MAGIGGPTVAKTYRILHAIFNTALDDDLIRRFLGMIFYASVNGAEADSSWENLTRLFGDPDYLLRIVTADLTAYQELEDDVLCALPGVQRLNSTLVMKHVVHDRPLPT